MTGRFWLITTLTLLATLMASNRFINNYRAVNQTNSQPSTVSVGQNTFLVEIANDDQEISQGLSGRLSLPKDQGMLFILGSKGIPTFWMKDMNFPLDFIWIDDDQVVDVTKNVPPPSPGESLAIYSPKAPSNYVLELNAGTVDEYQISIGDKVVIQ